MRCRNCNNRTSGAYCNRCGQKTSEGELRWLDLFNGITLGFFSVDQKLFNTIKGIVYKPYIIIADYIKGRRVSYFSPVPVLFILSGIYLLLAQLLYTDLFLSADQLIKVEEGDRVLIVNIINYIKQFAHSNPVASMFLVIPLYAGVLKLLFRKYKPDYRYIDHLFIVFFIACQYMLIELICLPINSFFGYGQINADVPYVGAIKSIALLALMFLSFRGLFNLSVAKAIRKLLLSGILLVTGALLISILLVLLLLLVYALTKV